MKLFIYVLALAAWAAALREKRHENCEWSVPFFSKQVLLLRGLLTLSNSLLAQARPHPLEEETPNYGQQGIETNP